MQRLFSTKRLGGLVATGWLLAALPGCADNQVADCAYRSCDFPPPLEDVSVTKDSSRTFEDVTPVDAGSSRSALCGTIGCFPGNRSACGVNPSGDSGFIYNFADANDGAESDAAETDLPDGTSSGATTDAGAKEDAADGSSTPDAASDAPNDTGANDEPRVSQSCYIQPAEAGPGVTTLCAPVGQVAEGSACDDSSDCVALDACVEVDGKGVCRPVSCALPISCPPGSFYQEAKLRVSGASSGLSVPVCLPNDHCTPLSQPNPCTRSLEECAVVGSQGETACILPGPGKQGDTCDETPTKRCAKGLLCSKFNDQCVRLCHVGADVNECVGGTCQGGSKSIPEGFGICVGEIPDASR